jgi:hypothetical protein
MQIITWSHPCHYCHHPITRGRPTLLFSINDGAFFIGVSHSTCCATKLKYGHLQMCPPNRFNSDQVSFLTHFFPMVYRLPGGENPNRELRWSLVRLFDEYPASIKNPIQILERFVRDHQKRGFEWLYEGDLEMDFLRFLGQVQRMAKEKPVEVEVDFRKLN